MIHIPFGLGIIEKSVFFIEFLIKTVIVRGVTSFISAVEPSIGELYSISVEKSLNKL